MILRCLLVEDEPLARERLADYARRVPRLELRGVFDNAGDALIFLREEAVDLIFLDIRLGGMSGLELLESTDLGCPVILTTAQSEHALKAFDLKVADYLLKPFTFERFVAAVERAEALVAAPRAGGEPGFLFVKTEHRLERVALDDLLYVEGEGDYRRLQLRGRDILTLMTFGDLERRLPPARFCRVHKSWLVALDKIDAVERDRITLGPVELPLSDSYRARFLALIDPGRR